MLVLTRKEGERIVIGDQITLIVSRVSGNRVAIGIEAPKDVKITRGELLVELTDEVAGASNLEVGVAAVATNKKRRTCPQTVKAKGSLREFAASVLPLQRQVG